MKNISYLTVLIILLLSTHPLYSQSISMECAECEACPEEKTWGLQGFDLEKICDVELQWETTPACTGEENGSVEISEITSGGSELDPAHIHFDWGSPSKSGNGRTSLDNAGAGYHQLRISIGEDCEQVYNFKVPGLELEEMYAFATNEIKPDAGNGSIEITEIRFSEPVENIFLIWQDMPGQVFNPPHIRENLGSGDYTVEILYGEGLCSISRTFTICTDEYAAEASYSEDFSGCQLGDDWLQEGFDWYIGESMDGGCHLETRSLDATLIWQPDNLSAYSNGMLYYDFTTFPEWSLESKLKVEYFPPDDIETELDWNSCLFGNVCRAEIYLPPLDDEGYFQFTFGSPSVNPAVVIDNILMEGPGIFHEASCPLEAQFGDQSRSLIQACEGESVYPGELLSTSGGSTSYRYDWDLDQDGQFDDFTGPYPVLENMNPGFYTISVRVTDRMGYTVTASTGLEILSSVPLSIGSPDITIPDNGIVEICAGSGPVRLTTNLPGAVLSGPGMDGDVFDPAAAGPGTWVIDARKNACSGRASLLIRVVEMPEVSMEELTIRPCDGNFNLNALLRPGVPGAWSGGQYVDEEGNFDPSMAQQGDNNVTFVAKVANCERAFDFWVHVGQEAGVSWQPPAEAVRSCDGKIGLNSLLDPSSTAAGVWTGGPYIVDGDRFDPSALAPGDYPVVYSAGAGSCYRSELHFIRVANCASDLSIRVFLENKMRGPGIMESAAEGNFPLEQPFGTTPFDYQGNESFASMEEVPANATDWLLLEYIDAGNGQVLERAAVLCRVDGAVTDLEGRELLPLYTEEDFRIRISHPDHHTVVSAGPASSENDFTADVSAVEDPGTVREVYAGLWAMRAELPLATDDAGGSESTAQMAVWPNPASDRITVSLASEKGLESGRVALFTADGRPALELYSGPLGEGDAWRRSFDLSSLPAGIYYLHLSSPDGLAVRKVVVSR